MSLGWKNLFFSCKKWTSHCFKYAHENNCPWDEYTCTYAAMNGHLDCLKYAHKNGCPWDDKKICRSTITNGNLECLKYAHENGGIINK